MAMPILEISKATKTYSRGLKKSGHVTVLKDIDLAIPHEPARIIAIAGESGSGKTTLAHSVLGFNPLTSGSIHFRGQDISRIRGRERFQYRRRVQAVFQDPYEVYNPFYRVRHIFDMAIRNFKLCANKSEARDLIEDALNVVGMRGREVLEKYPHQLSGGQRQRMMIARAYMLKPDLIVADEPVSMVDASLRAVILEAMQRLRDHHNISFLYITHDLSTAFQICDEIYVLYLGAVVERGNAQQVIRNPSHPYVRELISSIPVPDPDVAWEPDVKATGQMSILDRREAGCAFHDRCPYAIDRCLKQKPPFYGVAGSNREAACFLFEDKKNNGKS
jgi:peptide/nickel transport system ATP-binding protein